MTIDALRRLNSYEATGVFSSRRKGLDAMITEHLMLQRELRALRWDERAVFRLLVEGYKVLEIAKMTRIPRRRVRALQVQFREALLRCDPREEMRLAA